MQYKKKTKEGIVGVRRGKATFLAGRRSIYLYCVLVFRACCVESMVKPRGTVFPVGGCLIAVFQQRGLVFSGVEVKTLGAWVRDKVPAKDQEWDQ